MGERIRKGLEHAARIAGAAAALHATDAAAQKSPQTSAWKAEIHGSSVAGELSPYMRTYGDTKPPTDYENFCARVQDACKAMSDHTEGERMKRREGSDFDLSELADVQNEIQRIVKPMTDMQLYGVRERWAIAGKAGDCEDVALRKRYELIKRGWEPKDLLMTVVILPSGEGHAVLTARTARGDFILDNRNPEVALWSEFVKKYHYRFVSRQSYLNPDVWVAVDPGWKE